MACFSSLSYRIALTIYFTAIYIGASQGQAWALHNQTYVHMNSWFHYAKLYAATFGCIGFMILKYHWGKLGKAYWFKCFPFVIVAINIFIAVGSDFELAIRGMNALQTTGSQWWLSSEGVWLYGGWIQNRANTLAIWCMFAQVIPEFQDSGRFSVLPVLYKNGVMSPAVHPGAADPTMMGVIAILSLAINVVVFAIIWKRATSMGINPYTHEVFVGTKDYEEAMARAQK